jgi:dethiobiotin synthetase
LLKHLRLLGREAAGYKPVCCGERDDAILLQEAGNAALTINEINPLWLRVPAAPYAAAMIDNRPLDTGLLTRGFEALAERFEDVIVEGAGGWEVPIRRDYRIADLAAELALPVVVVALNRLGSLNHVLLTVEAIRRKGLTCAGVVLNHVVEERDFASITNRVILEEMLEVPVLGELLQGDDDLPDDVFLALEKSLAGM